MSMTNEIRAGGQEIGEIARFFPDSLREMDRIAGFHAERIRRVAAVDHDEDPAVR